MGRGSTAAKPDPRDHRRGVGEATYSLEVVRHFRDRWAYVLDSDEVFCGSLVVDENVWTSAVLKEIGAVPLGLAIDPDWDNSPALDPFLERFRTSNMVAWPEESPACALPAAEGRPTPWGVREIAWYFPEYGAIIAQSSGHNKLSLCPETVELCLHTRKSKLVELADDLRRVAEVFRLANRTVVGLSGSDDLQNIQQPLEDVILSGRALESVVSALDMFLEGPEAFHSLGLPWRRGVLLYGPPGCGKTLLTRALASRTLDARASVAYRVIGAHGAELGEDWNYCVQHAPCLFILEDVDGLFRGAGSRSELLNLLDGLKSGEGVFLLATTNFPEEVDPALVGRAGRFDLSINIPLPGDKARREYLERMWRGRPWLNLLDVAVRESRGLGMAALNSIHFEAATHYLRGEPMTESALADFIETMRRVETNKQTARWDDPDGRRRVGFSGAKLERDDP